MAKKFTTAEFQSFVVEQFRIIAEQFTGVHGRFNSVDKRFNAIEGRLDSVEGILKSLGKAFDKDSQTLFKHSRRISRLEKQRV